MHFFTTGAARCIGQELVARFVARGDTVTAADIDADGLHRARLARRWPAERVRAVVLDVREAASWDTIYDEAEAAAGPVDVHLNVARYLDPDRGAAIQPEAVHRHLDINTKGVIFGTLAAARRMTARGRSHIINIGSLAGLSPVPGLSLYAASKFAARGFILSMALELRPQEVHVTLVNPDAVQTAMLDVQKGREEAALTFSGGRILTPGDVAERVVAALKARPVETTIPAHRGVLAQVAALSPGLSRRLEPLMRRLGRRRQESYREEE